MRLRSLTLFACLATAEVTSAQLVVTEIMYNPASAEQTWEWIEVFNPSDSIVDLSGYFFDRVGDEARGTNPLPSIRPVVSVDGAAVLNPTRVSGGRTAILYNGDALGFDTDRFRAAWPGIPAAVPLIGVSAWGANSLTNDPGPPDYGPSSVGLTVGLWPNESAYRADTAELGVFPNFDDRVVDIQNADFWFSYANGGEWPSPGNGASIHYDGVGSPSAGGSWSSSTPGAAGVDMSTPTFVAGGIINGPDRGSPGIAPPGTPPTPGAGPALLITEIMYNPASSSGSREWEWIEVYNYGSTTIDFASTPMWLDDDEGQLSGPNLFFGSIPAGETAVFFDANAATLAQTQAAWDESDPNRFIPIIAWPTLANSGDTISIWDSSIFYSIDKINGDEANALVSIDYDDASPWPTDNNADSIYLRNLGFTATNGAAWSRSSGAWLPDLAGYRAAVVIDTEGVTDNVGGEIGSPGHYPAATPPIAGDYNNNGRFDPADYTVWRDGQPLANETASPGINDEADYLAWQTAFLAQNLANPVPEPPFAGLSTVAAAIAGCLRYREQR